MPEPLLHILLVEDDEDDAVLARSALREIPGVRYQLEWASTFEAARPRLLNSEFDAALIDFRLGERTGLELIHDAIAAGSRTAMILLTGQGERELDIDALGAGASDFLNKAQLSPGLLERSIRYAIQRKKSEHDRISLFQEQAARERAEAAAEAVREHALRLETEIAERTRAETALRRSEESFRSLADSMPQIVWASKPDGTVTYLNRRWYEYTGLGDGETFTGEVRARVLHPDDVERVERAWARALQSGEPLQVEFRLRAASGKHRWQLARANAVRDAAGSVTGWFGTSTDIDDHKRAEQAAAEHARRLAISNAELESFAYVASHDLKEPLRGISAYAEMLLEDLGPVADAESREKLRTLVRLCKRMYDLLDSLLELSRVGRAEVAFAEVDLSDVAADVLEQLRARLEQEQAHVLVGPLPRVVCDRVRVNQVISNLVTNALKYNSKPEKRVEVGSFADHDGTPVIYIRDNGIGIAERHHESVFRVFRRLHPRDAYGGGTGIGLAIVKRIIQQHGGRIWLQSTPGEGSTFFFTLSPQTAPDVPARFDDRRSPAGREAGLIEPRRQESVPADPLG
jgi:PAS domain S-box-containing protein